MREQKDNYVINNQNSIFELAITSVLGDREDQQDSAGYELRNDEGIVVVCDGMGGHLGGKTASTMAVDITLNRYIDSYPCDSPSNLLTDSAMDADHKIAALKNQNGDPLYAGTTIAAVYIKRMQLYWLSIGDSRIYIFRGKRIARATLDHNLKSLLDLKLETGYIDRATYDGQINKGDALVSFLGINGIPYIEANDNPLELITGDKVLITTDGLYRLLTDEEIERILINFENTVDALFAIEKKAQKNAKDVLRDNMTIALIKVK